MVSIIIPLKRDQGYLKPCLEACFQNAGTEIEVIVLPDDPLGWEDPRVRVQPTGPALPARKRNLGVLLSRGEFLAFIDDDTLPKAGWLQATMPHFADPKVGAVGGPSVTPADDPFWAQVSGAVYESWMVSGGARNRYVPTRPADVDDWPSCNLIVRRSVFEELGGFGTNFWPGEDTEFCLALVRKGYRIHYEPRALIEHHRRPSLSRHFRQLANYGLHRGYFAKRFPETSLRLQYFLPSLFVLGGLLVAGLAFAHVAFGEWLLLFLGAIYVIAAALSLKPKPFRLQLCSICVILSSHVAYGVAFLAGLCAQRLPEEVPKTN